MSLPPPDAAFHWTRESWGDALRCRRLEAHAQHLFTSRQLRLPGDEAWRAALRSVQSVPERLVRVKQVHGRAVRILKRGEVPPDAYTYRPDGDAIVSNEPGLALAVMVADCVPILLCDPVGGAAAAIHAGWRGTSARIASTAVETMQRAFRTNPADLVAAIGPSVGPQDYRVGEALIQSFVEAGHDRTSVDAWFQRRGDALYLDLWKANADQLIDAGVDAGNVFCCGLSTVSHPAIFDSYRVDGEHAGRMSGLIVVP
jgi:polyphenol oxidase